MYLVTACFDNQTSHALDRIIDDTAEFTGNDFMTANHIPSHLTLLQFHSKADAEKIISVCNYSPQKIYKKLTLPTVYRNSNVIEF